MLSTLELLLQNSLNPPTPILQKQHKRRAQQKYLLQTLRMCELERFWSWNVHTSSVEYNEKKMLKIQVFLFLLLFVDL